MPESPKLRFQKTATSKEFAGVANSAMFEMACDFAMLQFVDKLPIGSISNESYNAAANALRLEGARMFRAELQALSSAQEPRRVDKSGRLEEPK